jgi:undecaprenyl diphosphate synthase
MSVNPSIPIKHVAIIMDGNGRWAQSRCHQRVWGHVRGSRVVSRIVEEADAMGVDALTLYAFSSENWARPLSEIHILFKLLKKFLMMERDRILKNQIRFKVMGDISSLPQETKDLIHKLESETSEFKGLKLTFAFGYGGRAEIVQAANKFHDIYPNKEMTEEDLQSMLFVPELGDVDLLIRTGGDQRISNFLLWQLAYAELYFTLTKWPDFTCREFREILIEVMSRERRFGGIQASAHLGQSTCLAEENKKMLYQRSFQ